MPRLARLVAGGALLVTLACASVPPAATPAASPAALTPDRRLAFEQLRVRQALDLLRDHTKAASQQTPPVVSPAFARLVAVSHDQLLRIVNQGQPDWRLSVSRGLDLLAQSVPPDHRLRMAPYLALVRAALQDVP